MFGWQDKVLHVNLSRGQVSSEPLDPKMARDYLGGRGLGVRWLLDRLDPTCDPLSPENIMVMAAGPLTGTRAPTGARYMITTKSPLTGAITCSNSGGYFPAALMKAGIQAVIFEGRAPEPVYLWIDEGAAELRPARHLWGGTTHQTIEKILEETSPAARVAAIGPAGERQVLFASIMNDRDRAAGRSGVGAVMGSKNLKAVAVKGSGQVPLADPIGFQTLVAEILARFKAANKGNPPPLRTYGTAGSLPLLQKYGILPTRNFQEGTFSGWESITGAALTERFLKRPKSCFSCPIGCGRVTEITEGKFQGKGEGPEYESIYALGSDCGVDNLAAITKANYLCNELGLDTMTMGGTLACAMELYEKGILPESDIGRPLRFGDAEAVVELVRQTAYREGFGQLLALGSARLAEQYGRPELAMVSKKQEFAGYDPRGAQGLGLAYATSPIGASHMRALTAYTELFNVPVPTDPHSWEDKPRLVKDWQDVFALIDAAGLCILFTVRNLVTPTIAIQPKGLMDLINCATGANYEIEEFLKVGERILNAERLFLNRAGIDRAQDTLPPRLTGESMTEGPARGKVCRLDDMLPVYYQVRGWDEQGRPTPAKLAELGLV